MEAQRLKCLVLGPLLIALGIWVTTMSLTLLGGPFKLDFGWQVYLIGPAMILGGVVICWIAFRSRKPSRDETKRAAKEAGLDVALKILEELGK